MEFLKNNLMATKVPPGVAREPGWCDDDTYFA